MIVNYSGKIEKNQPKLALHSPQDSKTPSIIVLFDEDIQPTHLYSQEEQKDIINTWIRIRNFNYETPQTSPPIQQKFID